MCFGKSWALGHRRYDELVGPQLGYGSGIDARLFTVGAYVFPTIEVFEGGQLDGCWRCAGCTAPRVQVGVLHPVGPCLGFVNGGKGIRFDRTEGVELYFQSADVDRGACFLACLVVFFQVACSLSRR